MSLPQCKGCQHSWELNPPREKGHCYMFAEPPEDCQCHLPPPRGRAARAGLRLAMLAVSLGVDLSDLTPKNDLQ